MSDPEPNEAPVEEPRRGARDLVLACAGFGLAYLGASKFVALVAAAGGDGEEPLTAWEVTRQAAYGIAFLVAAVLLWNRAPGLRGGAEGPGD